MALNKQYVFLIVKAAVGEAVAETLKPIQQKTNDLLKNKDYLEQIYTNGARKALQISKRMVDKVYRKVGFVKSSL